MLPNSFSPNETPLDETQSSAVERRAFLGIDDFRERAIFVVARNIIPIVGVLFLGWSAPNLLMLYFVDTLGGMWAVMMDVSMMFAPFAGGQTVAKRIQGTLSALAVSLFLIAFFAIPLGTPVFILMAMLDWSLQDALANQDFIYGLISIVAISVLGMLRALGTDKAKDPKDSIFRRQFGLLFARWVVVLILIYFVGFALGEIGAVLLVIGYAAATVASELYPERFLSIFDSSYRTPNGAAPAEPRAARVPFRKKKKP